MFKEANLSQQNPFQLSLLQTRQAAATFRRSYQYSNYPLSTWTAIILGFKSDNAMNARDTWNIPANPLYL